MNTQNIFYLFEEISPFKKRGKISTEYFNFFLKILSSTQIVGISPVINLVVSSTLLKKINVGHLFINQRELSYVLVCNLYCGGSPRKLKAKSHWVHLLSHVTKCYEKYFICDKYFYHINYGVIQGFPALRKTVNTLKKISNLFHVRLISPISCSHVTRLSRCSVRMMNEQRSLHHSQSKIVCRNFSGLELLKHWKICVAYRQRRSDFRRRRRKPKYGKKNQKLRIQWLW